MLLRCHVSGGANPRANLGRQGGLNLGYPEVGDLDPAIIGNHDVGRLDIAMHHLVAVRMFERIKDIAHDANDLLEIKFLALIEIFF